MPLSQRLNARKPHVRRLAAHGWTADAIARAYQLTRAEVRMILQTPVRPPSPTGPDRPIWARLATRVRRLHDEGRSDAAIALQLDLDPGRVEDFFRRLTPRQAHHRRRQQDILNRPRSRREQAALCEWDRLATDDPLGPPPAIADVDVPELLPVASGPVEVPTQIWPATVGPREDWGPMQASWTSGGTNGNAALTDADAVAIRHRRAEGVPRADLAREYGVSVATITRITRGDTYRDAAAAEVLDLVEVIPAPPPVPEPQGERWVEPPGDRRRRGDD
jgi:transcriptional regulator